MPENITPESDEIFLSSGTDVIAITGSPAYSFVSDPDTGIFTQNDLQVTIQAVSSGTWFLPPASSNTEYILNSAVWTFDGGSIPIISAGPMIPYAGLGINGLIQSYNPSIVYKTYKDIVAEVEVKPEVEIDPTDIFEIF